MFMVSGNNNIPNSTLTNDLELQKIYLQQFKLQIESAKLNCTKFPFKERLEC